MLPAIVSLLVDPRLEVEAVRITKVVDDPLIRSNQIFACWTTYWSVESFEALARE